MEHIISFLSDQIPNPDLFSIKITGITGPDPGYRIVRECSDIHCLEYVLGGKGTIEVDDKIFYPQKGDVYLLPAGTNHHYYACAADPFEKIWLNVSGSLCDTLISSYGLDRQILFRSCNALPLFRSFLSTCEQKELSCREIFHKTSLIFHELTTLLHDHGNLSDEKLPSNPAALRIRDFIDKNIYGHFTMQLLANMACLSASQITRIFRKEYGQTPYDYILTQKIATARVLLKSTNMSVKEIAYCLSFSDEHYFSGLFKQKTGQAPIFFKSKQPRPEHSRPKL